LRGVTAALLALLFGVSTLHACTMPRRIDMNYSQYGWRVDAWRKGVYRNNQALYTQLMNRHYTDAMWATARKAADQFAWSRRAAQFVFQNQAITQRQLGPVAKGFPVWTRRMDCRISAYSDHLEGGLVVDSGALPLRDHYFSEPTLVDTPSDSMDKIRSPHGEGLLSVLPRADLEVLLFVERADSETAAGLLGATAGSEVILEQPNGPIQMQGLAIDHYTELPVALLRHGYFFVLLRK
jgi:hypothetical protein